MTRTASFLANVLGRSVSLLPVKSVLGIRRQGNGNFAVTLFHEYADGKRAGSDLGMNFRSVADASEFASSQAKQHGAPVVVLASAKAA
ncbi:hypothetical protein AFCDBAGC_1826 [Methylobacterium cerastii]|uniref:Uncharacterized protein n=1 Tax=Methylobacterium cerastii TaxID=932741 RepID=A0ABQ4QFD4_9HYPH|nr:hypothetical protein [Methylobacterium cerastii]GJD43964.1 hypothetical protein AFCDBAGC_1826 [Methylobacterium cerastii]